MNKLTYISIVALTLCTACKNESPKQQQIKEIEEVVKTQPAGTLLAVDSMRFTEDELNDFYFVVKLKTTEYSSKGTYAVEASVGPKVAASKFTMPRGAEAVIPIMHKVKDFTSFIIGFHFGNDTTFYDYYQIKTEMGNIEMKYLRAYRFD